MKVFQEDRSLCDLELEGHNIEFRRLEHGVDALSQRVGMRANDRLFTTCN